MKYIVKEKNTLLDFLLLHYARKQVKNLLKYKQVQVNNQVVTKFDYLLSVDDQVIISKESKQTNDLDIIYEDSECVVINKPAGLLSMSDGKEKQKTAYHLVGEYLRKKDRQAKVFIVHRLDRETSGVLLFAKQEKYKQLLQARWNDIVYKRGYIAIVEGVLKNKDGVIKNYLDENKTHQVYVTKKGGKLAITKYHVLATNKGYSVVEVFLDTGRKNQIRVHMQHIGHSIVNDKKYGATSNPIQRLGLHAHIFGFQHPVTKKKMEFTAPIPTEFNKIYTTKKL
ncbi:MAG: RluA family pseudouridine synthase [Coprobacillaceae bacterium]